MPALYCVGQCSRLQVRQQTLAIGNGTDPGREPVTDEQPTSAAAAKPTVTLESFLTARYAEDENRAQRDVKKWIAGRWVDYFTAISWPSYDDFLDSVNEAAGLLAAEMPEAVVADPARVLADIAAKRRILELHSQPHECPEVDGTTWYMLMSAPESVDQPCPTQRMLASVYADHPDYDPEEWEVGA